MSRKHEYTRAFSLNATPVTRGVIRYNAKITNDNENEDEVIIPVAFV